MDAPGAKGRTHSAPDDAATRGIADLKVIRLPYGNKGE
jgi:hypothetical protein